MTSDRQQSKNVTSARAWCLGERLDLRHWQASLAMAPPVIAIDDAAWAVLFRYGAVVLFNATEDRERVFLDQLKPRTVDPYMQPEVEEAEIVIDAHCQEGLESGIVLLKELSIARMQVVAEILATSVVLAQQEEAIARVFDQVEPLAVDVQRGGTGRRQLREVLRHIGSALMIQHKMVGRVAVHDKPELLWERSEFERLYLRLEDEYEIRERHVALERKLTLISETAQTLLELLQTRRSLRVEWYIVILIVVEILLTLYSMFIRPASH